MPAIAEFRSRVDMSLNKMSSQPATHLDRTLEIDAIAGLSLSQVGSIERFWPGLDLKSRRLGRHYGQTAATHSHALAELKRIAGRKIWP